MIDYRNIGTGHPIREDGYIDQPYIVVAEDATWVCVATVCDTREGAPGQHVVSCRSTDKGQTWTDSVDIENPDCPVSSWAMPFLTPYGRIYAFYTFNEDNLESVISDDGPIGRVDTLGTMAFRYSDDNGLHWSSERGSVPIRNFACDLANPYDGKIQFWWGVGKPILHEGAMILGFAKVHRFGWGFMAASEGAFIRSDNIATEPDTHKLVFETLPEGDTGIRPLEGSVADEHNAVGLADGSLLCTYRTTSGHPGHAYSRDGGRNWSPPAHMDYGPGKRLVKHPRAANFVKRFSNGKYLYWFHNNSLGDYHFSAKRYNANRNPVWLLGGIERDGFIHWSEPEIALYADEPGDGISYPDFVEDGGEIYVSETEKEAARIHKLDPYMLQGLWGELGEASTLDGKVRERRKLTPILDLDSPRPGDYKMPRLPNLDLRERFKKPAPPDHDFRGAFTIELRLNCAGMQPFAPIFDTRDKSGRGLLAYFTDRGTICLLMNDSRTQVSWECDQGVLKRGQDHVLYAVVDGCPKTVYWVVDGLMNDGGDERMFGWGRIYSLRDVNGSDRIRTGSAVAIDRLAVYDTFLYTFEAI